ncbi:MAG: hypothetical protein WBX02_21800 [Terriglobales bacterium]
MEETVAMETINLCGFDVPVFRGAVPIPDELVAKLKEPLPKDAVKENSDPKKKGMSSIKSIYITERLNEVFGLGQWIQVDKFVEKVAKPEGSGKGDSIVLKSILVVPKYGIYFEAYGGNDNYDPGDAYKGACTDALTKMAAFLYVGMDVFKGHPETSNQPARPAAKTTAPVTPPTPPARKCADCTGEIKAVKIGATDYPADSVRAAALRNYNAELCAGCQRKRRDAASGLAAMPAHTDQTPKATNGRLLNATEKRAFWAAAKQGRKSELAIREYFVSLGIRDTSEMPHTAFDAAMKWACSLEAGNGKAA